jgi:hypothetical protein
MDFGSETSGEYTGHPLRNIFSYPAKAVNLRLMISCIYVGVATSPVRKGLQIPIDICGRNI